MQALVSPYLSFASEVIPFATGLRHSRSLALASLLY
jgi:hypothetical protein